MRYTSTAEVSIPAHRFPQFKKALIRHAPSEHVGIEVGNITAYELRREGPSMIVRVLIDSIADFTGLGGFADQFETEDSRDAATQSIGYAIHKVSGSHEFSVDTERAE